MFISIEKGSKSALKNYNYKRITAAFVCLAGLVLLLVGIFMRVPGTALTTYENLDGVKSSYGDGRYSSIEEYVGGDAYNYIIGASLVGARISGVKAEKAIFISFGLLLLSIGGLSIADPMKSCEGKREAAKEPTETIPTESLAEPEPPAQIAETESPQA